jgi:hypothetical protein
MRSRRCSGDTAEKRAEGHTGVVAGWSTGVRHSQNSFHRRLRSSSTSAASCSTARMASRKPFVTVSSCAASRSSTDRISLISASSALPRVRNCALTSSKETRTLSLPRFDGAVRYSILPSRFQLRIELPEQPTIAAASATDTQRVTQLRPRSLRRLPVHKSERAFRGATSRHASASNRLPPTPRRSHATRVPLGEARQYDA